MTGEGGRRAENLRLLYAKQRREGETFDVFVARLAPKGSRRASSRTRAAPKDVETSVMSRRRVEIQRNSMAAADDHATIPKMKMLGSWRVKP